VIGVAPPHFFTLQVACDFEVSDYFVDSPLREAQGQGDITSSAAGMPGDMAED